MTRKDYILLAGHISNAVEWGHVDSHGVAEIADALASDNYNFDRRRFYKACGVEEKA